MDDHLPPKRSQSPMFVVRNGVPKHGKLVTCRGSKNTVQCTHLSFVVGSLKSRLPKIWALQVHQTESTKNRTVLQNSIMNQ